MLASWSCAITVPFNNASAITAYRPEYCASEQGDAWLRQGSEKCLKAAVIEGKAYVGLKQYDKAIQCYEKAKKIYARKERVINEYIDHNNHNHNHKNNL